MIKNWKLLLGLFSDKKSLGIIFNDPLVRKQALLNYKKMILQIGHIGFFSKGVPHDCDQKLEITPWFVFGQKKPRNNI